MACSRTNTESTSVNNYNNLTTTSTSEKNTKHSSDFGIDSVKSLRERLDKKLKAISETIDTISKKESMRGVSSSRDKERIEFSAGTEKKPTYNNNLTSVDNDNLLKFNENNGNGSINNSESRGNRFENKLDNLKAQLFNNNNINSNLKFMNKDSFSNNQDNNKEDLDRNSTGNKYNLEALNAVPIFNAQNQILNLKEKDTNLVNSRGNSGNKNLNKNKKESNNYNIPKNENLTNLNFTHSTDNKLKPKEEIRQIINNNENLVVRTKSNILINDNFDVNKIENSPSQEDFNNINFLNNTSTAGMELKNQYPKNFMLEENFISNDPNYKNLINNEISKISHDNFNDEEADPISDNEVEDFEIKRKKFHNIAIAGITEEEREAQKNLFLNKKTEDKILGDIEDLNSLQNSKSQKDKGTLDPNKNQDYKKFTEKDYLNNLNAKLNTIASNINKNKDNLEKNDTNSIINPKNINNSINNNQFSNFLPASKEKKSSAQLRNSSNNNRFNVNNIKDEISIVHNVNNSIEKIEQSIRVHDENLLQKIEEVNKEKYQEALRNQEELEKIEANLSLMQRLTHEKWQIRKNAFKQISELIITLQANNKSQSEGENYDIAETMETLFPWLKYLITDTNIVALNEGLNSFCYLLDYCNNEQRNKALILFFDELEKLIMHNKNSISDLCLKIIINAASTKKFASFTISELIRKLNTTNNKLLLFLHRAIEEMLDGAGLISEHYLKLFFEKTVLYFNSAKQLNKNLERKKIYGKIITTIFERITDDSDTLKHHLNLNAEDAANFDKLLLKANKDKKDNKLNNLNNNNDKDNFTLYETIAEAKIAHSAGNNANNYNTNKTKGAENNAVGSSNKNVAGAISNFTLKDGNSDLKSYNSNNNLLSLNLNGNNTITEVVDLFNILPNEFFEIPYITALKTKKEILENVNRKLLDYVNIKDREYKEILNIINYTIDDTNVLVNLEGIKFLKNFCRLTKNTTNQTKLKNLVISCYEKFKDKKTNVKLELFDLFDTILLNHIFQLEQFFVFKLQHVISQKNPIVKQNILEYVKEAFSKSDKAVKSIDSNMQQNKEENSEAIGNYKSNLKTEESVSRSRAKSRDFRSNLTQEIATKSESQVKDNAINSPNNNDENLNSLKEILNKNLQSKTIVALSKILVNIIKDDSQSQVKDLSVEILLILKSILQNESDSAALEKFENLISSLPNFRVNMIITGRTKSTTENTNTEREYKANLNKIKSNLQNYSRNKSQQKAGRLDTAQSVNKDGKESNNKIKNALNKNRNKINIETSHTNYENTERNEENENEKSLKKNAFRKINSKYLVKNKLAGGKNNNSHLKNEDSKFTENNISENEDDDHDSIKPSKNVKSGNQNIKSPNIKLISKKGVKESAEAHDNKDKYANKKKLDFDDSVSTEKLKKIKQKDKDEKVKKDLRDKSQNKANLIKKAKQLNDNVIKKIKPGDISKASANEDSMYSENSMDKFTLNKNKTKSKAIVKSDKIKNKPLKTNAINKQNNKSETSSANDNAPPTSNRTDRSNLEKKMDSAIEYISNLNEEHIFDYTKSVIRDFLIFIKKVTSANNEKEDLDCHFKVIIKILDNIFDHMETLANKLDFALNHFIPEEIFIQTFKIVITAPCFLIEIESVLLPFIQKLRRIISNDAKFFDIYFEILNKFICFEKGSSFLQGVNSKNTFIVFYDFFLFDAPKFEDLEILRKFEPYISKNIFFSDEEKTKYIKEYRQAIHDIEHRQIPNKDLDNSNDEIEENESFASNDKRSFMNKNMNSKTQHKEKEEELRDNENLNRYGDQINYDNRSLNHAEEDEEEVFLQNYANKFKFNKPNEIVISAEPRIEEEINIETSANYTDKFKSQSFKNSAILKNDIENKRNEERSQTTEKALDINLPENLDKDISKIKDSIKEKCRKLDMNIKRINNKIESEINPLNSNTTPERVIDTVPYTNNANTGNSSNFNSKNDNQLHNKFNDYKNKMKQQNLNNNINPNNDVNNNNSNNNNFFKPKRNLEELEEIEAHEDDEFGNVYNKDLKDELYDVHNLPKLNNFIQNKINNLPLSNRTHEMHNNNQMLINNFNADQNERQGVIPNRINNNNLMLNKNTSSINTNTTQGQNNNTDEIKKLILKIPSIILDDCVSEISHYVSLENSFMKMNYELKNEFMTFLSSSINNDSLIKTSSFNCFLQLLEFLLTLLIYEMKNNQKTNIDISTKNIIVKLQETIENILKHKSFTEIFKVLIFLLRKYLPEDFNVQIDRDNLIYLKTISYLLKINLENKIKQQASVNTIEILSEINELFLMYSPANLNPDIPNLEDLDKVYKLLRLLTDDAVTGMQNLPMAKLFLDNAKKSDSNKYCSIYLQYLENVINL